ASGNRSTVAATRCMRAFARHRRAWSECALAPTRLHRSPSAHVPVLMSRAVARHVVHERRVPMPKLVTARGVIAVFLFTVVLTGGCRRDETESRTAEGTAGTKAV